MLKSRIDCGRNRRARQRGADLVAQARALVPTIAAAADRIERERVIPQDVLDAMHAARLFRTLIPKSLGGEEVEPTVFCL